MKKRYQAYLLKGKQSEYYRTTRLKTLKSQTLPASPTIVSLIISILNQNKHTFHSTRVLDKNIRTHIQPPLMSPGAFQITFKTEA